MKDTSKVIRPDDPGGKVLRLVIVLVEIAVILLGNHILDKSSDESIRKY